MSIQEKKELLEVMFLKGTPPKNLNGFYKGRLELLLPENFIESLASVIAHFWIPWYGKTFDSDREQGDNVLPLFLLSLIQLRYGKKTILGKERNGVHVFPFKTIIQKALKDPLPVLRLDYTSLENPPIVRNVLDELVCIRKDTYLGKAYLKKNNNYTLVAFFSLKK